MCVNESRTLQVNLDGFMNGKELCNCLVWEDCFEFTSTNAIGNLIVKAMGREPDTYEGNKGYWLKDIMSQWRAVRQEPFGQCIGCYLYFAESTFIGRYCEECYTQSRYDWTCPENSVRESKDWMRDEAMDWQCGKCDICGVSVSAPQLDHDHDNGLGRAVLCHACNQKMSAVDNKEWLEKGIAYRDRYAQQHLYFGGRLYSTGKRVIPLWQQLELF